MHRLFFAPLDSSGLAMYRILFGLLNAIGLIRFWYMGWIEKLLLEPKFLFKYYGFEWVSLWPGNGIYIHFALLIAVCVLLTFGLFTRLMSLLFFLGFCYIELLDLSNYLNHYYLISLLAFIGIFLPLNARWALDNYLGFAKRRLAVPAWTINVLRAQVGTVYFFAGLAKLGSDWLLQAQPLNIWLTGHSAMPFVGWIFAEPLVHYAFSWVGFIFDISIVYWLLNARTRPWAYAVVVVFHLITWLLFPIGMFPFIMIVSALVFFDSDWPLRVVKLWTRNEAAAGTRQTSKLQFIRQPALAVVIGLFFLVQWAVPLRHFAYPGNVLWNEEGMRFSWKVMVREKNSDVSFRITDRQSGRTWYQSPSEFIMRHQEAEMSGTPDMIVQFAHFLKQHFAEQGMDVEIYADSTASFNGRSSQPLIDPNVDLTTVSDGLSAKDWILPEPIAEPKRLHWRASFP